MLRSRFIDSPKSDSADSLRRADARTDSTRTKDGPLKIESDATANPPELSPKETEEIRGRAKGALAGLYAAQRAYFLENNRYSTDLKNIGWQPPSSVMQFKLGFINPFNPVKYSDYDQNLENPRRLDSDTFVGEKVDGAGEVYSYDRPVAGLRLSDYEKFCESRCTAGPSGFEVMILVPLGDSGKVDVWTVNEKKELKLLNASQ